MNLCEYWEQELAYKFNKLLDDADFGWTVDNSEFIVVDGEEGDYGKIKYYDSLGILMATKVVLGGDDEYIEFTEDGKLELNYKLSETLKLLLDNTQFLL